MKVFLFLDLEFGPVGLEMDSTLAPLKKEEKRKWKKRKKEAGLKEKIEVIWDLDHEEEGREQDLGMDLDSDRGWEGQEEVFWLLLKTKKTMMKQHRSWEGLKLVQIEEMEEEDWQLDEGIEDQKKEEVEDCAKVFRCLAR